jgi:hypothetical protein
MNIDAHQPHLSFSGRIKAGDAIHGRGLSGPIRSKQSKTLALEDVERYSIDGS